MNAVINDNIHIQRLITEYMNNHMEKVYYFCLKKTSNDIEAEDLASEITISIISQFRKGNIPTQYSAWIWKIARNHYSFWAKKKRHSIDTVSGVDINDYDITDNYMVDEEYINKEELLLLRRELAFITKDYRDILVAYYIKGKKVHEIAATLNIPEGTVKTKLFKSRNKLKEGMEMSRAFGSRSYNPEEVRFSATGNQPSGLPWRAVNRQIPKNILLQANNNPSTIEELSIELGIAMPYMEEEVNILVDSTLLKQIDNKYITNFFIASNECQKDIYGISKYNSIKFSEMMNKLIDDSMTDIKKLNIIRNDMSDNDFRWLLVLYLADHFINVNDKYTIEPNVKRNDGGDWGFTGYEIGNSNAPNSIGHNGSGNGEYMSWSYKIGEYGLLNRVGEMGFNQALVLGDIIKHNRNYNDLSDTEKKIIDDIMNRFVHVDSDGTIIPDIAVFDTVSRKGIIDIIKSHSLYNDIADIINKVFDEVINVLKSYSTPVLDEQLNFNASMFIFSIRMYLIMNSVENNKLIVPSEPDKSTIAMYFDMK